jgi:hypothetical protein
LDRIDVIDSTINSWSSTTKIRIIDIPRFLFYYIGSSVILQRLTYYDQIQKKSDPHQTSFALVKPIRTSHDYPQIDWSLITITIISSKFIPTSRLIKYGHVVIILPERASI